MRESRIRFCASVGHLMLGFGLVTCLFAMPANAQKVVPARVTFEPARQCNSATKGSPVDTLAAVYWTGSATKTADALKTALIECGFATSDSARASAKKDTARLDLRHDYVLVSLISAVGSAVVESGAKKPQILHFLLRPGNRDYRLIMSDARPRSGHAFQVVLYAPGTLTFTSILSETQVPSPLATDLVAFVKQVSLASYYPVNRATALGPRALTAAIDSTASMSAQLGELPIQFREGTMALTELAEITPPPTKVKAKIEEAIAHQMTVLTGLNHSDSSCVAKMARAAKKAVDGDLPDMSVLGFVLKDTTLLDVIDAALKKEKCGGALITPAQVDSVRSRFQAAVASPTSQVSGSATISNPRLVHFKYGAIVGALVGRMHPGDQVKTNSDSKVYEADPLKRATTMAAVSWYPVPWDSTTNTKVLSLQRVSIDAGPVLTPTGGLGIGLSVGLARGLALSGGSMWLMLARGPGGKAPGDALPASGRQLKNAIAQSYYFGAKFGFP